MRPSKLKTRIFLDGADPGETRSLLGLLGFLDGQTTNPTLVSKNPAARARLAQGRRFDEGELLALYRGVVREVSGLLPAGSVSVEVTADANTPAEDMLRQGRAMSGWIPNAHIKFPTCAEGLKAAQQAVREGLRVNLTLCFSQQQAAAVYAATRGAKKGQVFVSPFVGRLDDRGQDGMGLVSNILRLYAPGDGHVEVLTASVRSVEHLLRALRLGSDIVTAPEVVLAEWARRGQPLPSPSDAYANPGLSPMPYEGVDLAQDWRGFDIRHELTDKGMEKFSADWADLIVAGREKAAS